MFDVWAGDIELTTLVVIFAVLVLLPVQLWICMKVKNIMVKLLPAVLLFVLTTIFYCMGIASSGWDGLGYVVIAIFTGIMLLACGFGWGIWAVFSMVKRKKN